jgi:transposase
MQKLGISRKKGRVESGVKYLKNGFVPLREFRTLEDANREFMAWVIQTEDNRIHGTTRQKL